MQSAKRWSPPRMLNLVGLTIVLASLALGAFVMLTRHSAFWNELPLLGPLSPGQHLSNFALSLIFLVGSCQFPLLMNARTVIYAFLAAMVGVNLLVELWIPILNTPDLCDAYAGLIGVVVAGACLWLVDHVGTRPAPPAPQG